MNATTERIFDLIKKHGLTQKQVATKVGISAANFTEWKKERNNPSAEAINKLADFFKVSADYLLCKTDNPSPIERWIKENSVDMSEVNTLPILGSVSAGNGVLAMDDIIGYESADSSYGIDDHFYLKVRGDSMSPHINDGDLVLVRRQDSVDSGTVGVFTIDGDEGVIKKIKYDDNHIELHSFNTEYAIRVFVGRDMLQVNVIGKVLESRRKW